MEQSFEGMLLKIDGTEVWSRLIGLHNAYNLLALYTTAITLGAKEDEALTAISTLAPAPGRLENIGGPREISVIIDYAHTPDALENVLKTLREIAPERQLICLFGCGGDRDRTKRPEMGRIAQKMADRIFVTSDNSRSESPQKILADILRGTDKEKPHIVIPDRREAIAYAVLNAQKGDILLFAGKGHERYEINREGKLPFDERETAREAYRQRISRR
jgi:UDP-N-acetylmuramoyl-L-alanyl-D-glutamate--2,6-diaminopimelate ligase